MENNTDIEDIFRDISPQTFTFTTKHETIHLVPSKCIFADDVTKQSRLILAPIICSFIILTNFIVVVSSGLMIKRGQEPQTTYLFLGSVALADLVTGISIIFKQFFIRKNPNHYACIILTGIILTAVFASGYSVLLIGVDRFFYIVHGIKYQQCINPKRARILMGIVWSLGCLIGFTPLIGWVRDTANGKCCYFLEFLPKEYIMITVIASTVPVLVVLVLYSIILQRAIRAINEIKKTRTIFEDSKTSATRSRCSAVMIVLLTSGSFFVTWMPNFLFNAVYVFYCEDNVERCRTIIVYLKGPLVTLVYVNGLINPIIYAWWHNDFRRFIKNRIRLIKIRNGIHGLQSVQTISKSVSHDNT